MKKKYYVGLVCLLLCLSPAMKGQVIRLDGGVAFSKLMSRGVKGFDQYDRKVMPFQMSVGVEYLDKELFNLSSSVGYIRKGGKSKIYETIDAVEPTVYADYLDYVTMNTLFVLKRSVRRETYYVGGGPRLDVKVGYHPGLPIDEDLSMNKFRPLVFGLKCELGFWYDLTDRYRLGVNFSYLPSFTKTWKPVADDAAIKLGDRTFTLGLSLGYRL